MVEASTCARPYSKAAFDYAHTSGQLDVWADGLALCARVVQHPKVATALADPTLSSSRKAQAFITVCQDQLDAALERFITLLAENKRLLLLPAISALFAQLKAQEEHSQAVQVTAALPLTAQQQDMITAKLAARLQCHVELRIAIDQTLLGGLIIKVGDQVIDGSLRNKLVRLADAIAA